jgi:hypothetical protein
VSSGTGFSATEAPKGPNEHGRAVFARPIHIARKPEPEPRSFSSANWWPSTEECAAERAAEIYTSTNNFPGNHRGHR